METKDQPVDGLDIIVFLTLLAIFCTYAFICLVLVANDAYWTLLGWKSVGTLMYSIYKKNTYLRGMFSG